MARYVHIHRYEKTEWGKKGTVVWRCTLEDCSHYLHPEMIKGRLCVCYKCGHSFKMTTEKVTRKRPTCDACQGLAEDRPVEKVVIKEEKKAIQSLADLDIKDLLKDL